MEKEKDVETKRGEKGGEEEEEKSKDTGNSIYFTNSILKIT